MIEDLLAANKAWAANKVRVDPNFFMRLVAQQSPEYLWIGCSDSRVPANDVVGRDPGEMFVHRNVANLCSPQDMNFLSVLQYAVEALKVRRILVVGHYGCGGVLASMNEPNHGLVDHWLGPVRAQALRHRDDLAAIADPQARHDRLVELNVIEQARLVNANPVVIHARERGQDIGVHGWVYSIRTGLVNDLHVPVPAGAHDPGASTRVRSAESPQAPRGTPVGQGAADQPPLTQPLVPPRKRGLFGPKA